MKLKNNELANIKTIVFDYGNVLLDIDISRFIEALEKLDIETFDPQDIHPNNVGVFLDMEVGRASIKDLITRIKSRCKNPDNITDTQITDAWNALLLPYDYRRFELLEELSENYRIVLLSNTNKAHHDYFEAKFDAENPFHRPFRSFFDHIFYSDELGLRKPGREIYAKVESLSALDPAKTLFIDDNASNLIEPRAIGWHTYHLIKPETVLDLFE